MRGKIMNKISGRITLKETHVGIPDLLIVVYDVDPKTQPEEMIGSNSPPMGLSLRGQGFPGDRIGSVLTDQNGAFEFLFEDAEFQIRNPEEKRPDLFLLVMPPEEPDKDLSGQVLYATSAIRQNAGRSEQYLIRLTTEQLKQAGVPIPTEPADNLEEPTAVIHKVTQAVERQEQIKQETQMIASKKVAIARERSQQIATELETRLIEKLTNVPVQHADRFNYVLPGTSVESVAWKTFNKGIDEVINPQKANTGYIVVPNSVLGHFQDASGDFRDDITADEIEPFIFGGEDDGERPTFLLREDPMSLMCQSQILPDSLQDEPVNGNESPPDMVTPTPSPDDNVNEGQDGRATTEDVPEYIARLMEGMTSPEETIAFGVRQQTGQGDVQDNITTFELRSGPADVPAFYDFHNLQIAFDYVWQQAIDEGVIEASSELYHQLLEMGGDPLPALQSGQDPIKVLRDEVRNVQRVRQEFDVQGIQYLMKSETPPANGTSTTPTPLQDLKDKFGIPLNNIGNEEHAPLPTRQPHHWLTELEDLLNEDYAFTVFAPGSTNFGLLVTYRQKWDPINYQVGNLVKTIPLTPGEERKITSKVVIKKERNVKEMENSLRIRKDESNETSRVEAEIVRKAEAKTNFSLTTEGTYNLWLSKGDITTNFGKESATTSQETKKSFREAVIKAAQEYKDERKVEVESKESFLDEEFESTVIRNDSKVTVTYLFYELQRRYQVSERIHRLTPVVLVAMEVPNPGRKAIDALLLTHGWIINRALLDDTYRRPLMYMSTRMVGDEYALREMKATLDQLRTLVNELKEEYLSIREQVGQRYAALEEALARRAEVVAEDESEGAGESAWEWIVGSGDEESIEAARLSEEAAKEAYEKAAQEEKQLRARLEREVTALNEATQAYSQKYAEHLNRRLEIARLRVHIKQNILYYMQAIWSTTFKDQIFFMLHKVKVPVLNSTSKTYSVSQPSQMPANVTVGPEQMVLEVSANVTLESDLDPEQDFKTLAEIADLDNPLGFKGNYMIFPLKESNPLTDYMMMPYVDSELGLHDPDDLGNWTPQEFAEYAACLNENLDPPVFDLMKGQLREQYMNLLSAPRRAEEEIIVPGPGGSLYIEALISPNPLIDQFQAKHRAMDVKKVQAEVREMELDNVRQADRVLKGVLGDPDIEKTILVQNDGDDPGLVVGDE
jgi:hypothetical protein